MGAAQQSLNIVLSAERRMRTVFRSMFKEIGEEGNERLKGKQVTVAGLGGIGSIVTSILAREDFSLRLIDKGRVEEVDLNRMGLYQEADITKFKAKQAKTRVAEINPKLPLKCFHEELAENNVFLVKSDCVIDCTNNAEASRLIFSYCQGAKIPLILAAYAGSKVYLLVATKRLAKKHLEAFLDHPSTEDVGAISPATHAAAAIAVAQLFKILLGKGKSWHIEFDTWTGKLKEKQL